MITLFRIFVFLMLKGSLSDRPGVVLADGTAMAWQSTIGWQPMRLSLECDPDFVEQAILVCTAPAFASEESRDLSKAQAGLVKVTLKYERLDLAARGQINQLLQTYSPGRLRAEWME